MKSILKCSLLSVFAVLVYAGCSNHACATEQETQKENNLVGRIAHIEGQLLRYVPDEDDWVLTEEDTPFGLYDNLFSSEDAKVEIIIPNNTLVRIGGDTQVQLVELTDELTEITLLSGVARLYNRSSSAGIRASTPFGDVRIPPEAVCDVSVHAEQAEIVSIEGSVEFIKAGSDTRHELIAGSSSIIVTAKQIVASTHGAVPAWDDWNIDRDAQWARRMQARGDSEKYLPESLQDHAWELEENGSWERVYYEGAYRYFWRPVYVDAGWTPFSSGRWIRWHGEHTWVPCEPFGYVTHHYGNWVRARECWYWAPPVSHVMVSSGGSFLNIGMFWYPGRVAWLSSSISVGWFPLAPYEIYYSSRYWGPRCKVRRHHHYYDYRGYRHHKHARFIKHNRFYGQKNYRHAGLRKGSRGEKIRGSVRFPERVRRNYKDRNRDRYASAIPGFRGKVKKADFQREVRDLEKLEKRQGRNPFKDRITRRSDNRRKAAKILKETKGGFVGKYKPERQRLASAKKNIKGQKRTGLSNGKKIKTRGSANRKIWNERFDKAKRTQPKVSKRVAQNRQKLNASRRLSTGRVKQKLATRKQNIPARKRIAKNSVGGRKNMPRYSGNMRVAKRSNKGVRTGNSYARSVPQRQSRNSSGRARQYAARGRRW